MSTKTIRLPALLAAVVLASAGPALSQTAEPGVSVAAARTWLIEKGGQVAEPVAQPGSFTLRVADALPWTLTFYGCTTVCADAQYSARFSGPAVTADWVNRWNRENRYLKAAFVAPEAAGGEAATVVTYDLVLSESGPDVLAQPTVIWKQLQTTFARALQQQATAVPATQ